MYRKSSDSWLKHYDFIIFDLLCLQAAFILAYLIRMGWVNPYASGMYRAMAVWLVFADLAVIFFDETFRGVFQRGYYIEFISVLKHTVLVVMAAVLRLFVTQTGKEYSRLALGLMGILYLIFSYAVRIAWKYLLQHRILADRKKSLLIITSGTNAKAVIDEVRSGMAVSYEITGLILLDGKKTGGKVAGVPVVADEETAASYICHHWVDEVLVHVALEASYPRRLIDDIAKTGVIIHISLTSISDAIGKGKLVEMLGNYTVLTLSVNCMTTKEAMLKRLLDIVGGLVGCILTAVLFVFLAPLICAASPGPIFFSQTRVGKNGKKFKIYKFRSMYMDAEERKKELLCQNRIEDGYMFKMEFDPRIIGNKVLADGTKKTGIGAFIRKTSLDEFPQFYNVLKGDMSLVGTRPPTVDEWEKYELHHRARLAVKPGITGMWQVNGRSKVTDFEEVVKLDTKYINEWSMGLDLRILFKTVLLVWKKDGSM